MYYIAPNLYGNSASKHVKKKILGFVNNKRTPAPCSPLQGTVPSLGWVVVRNVYDVYNNIVYISQINGNNIKAVVIKNFEN